MHIQGNWKAQTENYKEDNYVHRVGSLKQELTCHKWFFNKEYKPNIMSCEQFKAVIQSKIYKYIQ